MFAKSVVESDRFAGLPFSAQALYLHLGMSADDDGMVDAPRRVMRGIGATEDDLEALVAAGYVIEFDSGILAIRHWKRNNYIQKDRYKPSTHAEAARLVEEDGAYSLVDEVAGPRPECIQPSDARRDGTYTQEAPSVDTQDGDGVYTQVRLGKDRSGERKSSLGRGQSPRFSEELFERAWRAYPRKCGKKAAREAYRRSVRNGADPDAIQAGVERFAASSRGQPERFIPHGSTFFSQERWADEPMDKAAAPIVGAPAADDGGGWMPDAG